MIVPCARSVGAPARASSSIGASPFAISPGAEQTLVATLHARAVVEAAEMFGVQAAQLLGSAGLDADAVRDPYGRVRLADVERLTTLAVACAEEPAFGLVWGERSPMFGFDVIGLVFGHAPSLRAGLDVVLRCQVMLGSHPELAIEETATRTRICFRPMSRTELVARVRAELAMTGLVRLLRQGRSVGAADIVSVDFAHRRPPHHKEYTRTFGDRCRFERDETALVIERGVLDRASPTANAELHQLLVAQAERLLQRARQASSLAEQLRTHVRALLPRLPTMEDAAKGLGMSARSLRRRLNEEGISFTRIVQDSQRAVAELLLLDSGHTIQQVAGEAGFTSTTAFHRAFRRWTGESPQGYRDRSGTR